ncbi:MAG: TonB-dependent SusC/RagA subfamily outer membrane receptor [Arcticibacterium sp.]|jgi:TonB-dependent SusC/RagA subfamily outer membrane receptor
MKKTCAFFVALLLLGACTTKPTTSNNTTREKADLVDDGFTTKNSRSNASSAKSVETENDDITLESYLRRVPGVNISGTGYNARATIRGVKTMYGAKDALFVVDGVPLSGGLGQVAGLVQVRDIDRLTVLKDGSSTAIYGARGGSGVIVIKTKKK